MHRARLLIWAATSAKPPTFRKVFQRICNSHKIRNAQKLYRVNYNARYRKDFTQTTEGIASLSRIGSHPNFGWSVMYRRSPQYAKGWNTIYRKDPLQIGVTIVVKRITKKNCECRIRVSKSAKKYTESEGAHISKKQHNLYLDSGTQQEWQGCQKWIINSEHIANIE